jgi:cell fate regulator YaaT (PSP1 superfamily)
METRDYLLTFGSMGDVGRFRPERPLMCRRGDRVVVQSYRGLELGVVLCPATPGHARFFVNTSVGRVLRLASADDEKAALQRVQQARRLFDDSRRLTADLGLPLEILDAEVLLDGEQAVLHHLQWQECDERPFVSALSKQHAVRLSLHHLALPNSVVEAEEEHGNCGSCGSGECGSCATGGCGSCRSFRAEPFISPGETAHVHPSEEPVDNPLRPHFAALRARMQTRARTPLL